MLSYLLTPLALFFGVASVFFGAQPEGKKALCYISLFLFFLSVLGVVWISRRWMKESSSKEEELRVSAARDIETLNSNPAFENYYTHPIEVEYPSTPKKVALHRRVKRTFSRKGSNLIQSPITSELRGTLTSTAHSTLEIEA